MQRRGDGETGETGRQGRRGDGKTGRRGDGETGRRGCGRPVRSCKLAGADGRWRAGQTEAGAAYQASLLLSGTALLVVRDRQRSIHS